LLDSHRFVTTIAAILFCACSSSDSASTTERWLLEPDDPLPQSLSSVGVFDDMRSRTTYEDVVGYAPKHALFSNGLAKERYLYRYVSTTLRHSFLEFSEV
jgi:hypothetical protein